MEKNSSYNQVPYVSKPFSFTVPTNSKAVSYIFGVDTPDIENCKILEIGSSFGGNLISTAIFNPKAEIVGIDLSETQISEGNKIVKNIGLKNLKLLNKNVLEIDESFGKFDFIICHGVFSWVPKEVQDKILDVCKNNLNDNGLCFISYNTYPGWKNKEIMKDMMVFRSVINNKRGQLEAVGYGKGSLEFLKDNSLMYGDLNKDLINQIDYVMKDTDYYIFHEYFEQHNFPFYFYEFMDRANEYGLEFVAEAQMSDNFSQLVSEQARDAINRETPNRVYREQFTDFLENKQFRRTLLTKKSNTENLVTNSNFSKDRIENLYISSIIPYNEEKKMWVHGSIEIKPEGFLDDVIKKLNESYPSNVLVKDLIKAEIKSKKISDEDFEKINPLYEAILKLMTTGILHISTRKITVDKTKPKKINEKLKKFIEFYIQNQTNFVELSNFWNESLSMFNNVDLLLMTWFDGETTKEKMLEKLEGIIHENSSSLDFNGEKITDIKNNEKLKEHLNYLEVILENNLMLDNVTAK